MINNPSGLGGNAARQVVTLSRTFTLPGNNLSGLAKIRYSFGVGPGSQYSIYGDPYGYIGWRPFAMRYVVLNTVGFQTNPIDAAPAGILNWIAVA